MKIVDTIRQKTAVAALRVAIPICPETDPFVEKPTTTERIRLAIVFALTVVAWLADPHKEPEQSLFGGNNE